MFLAKIKVKPSKTADTRTCDYTKVTKDELRKSSEQHIEDVQKAISVFETLMMEASVIHDEDKLRDIDGFHRDFLTGPKIVEGEWLKNHYKIMRHHLHTPEGVRPDVNLIDVLDYVADQVMSQAGRGGNWPIKIEPQILMDAFNNTVKLLKDAVELVPAEQDK